MCKSHLSYSSGVCEAVLVKCKKLDTIFSVFYWPSDTTLEEWRSCVKVVEEEIILTQTYGDYRIVVIMGNFNFPSLIWDNKLVRIVQDMTQKQELFASILGNFCLFNSVEVPTRGVDILDLILTNDEDLISNVRVEESGCFSNHRWVIGDVDMTLA